MNVLAWIFCLFVEATGRVIVCNGEAGHQVLAGWNPACFLGLLIGSQEQTRKQVGWELEEKPWAKQRAWRIAKNGNKTEMRCGDESRECRVCMYMRLYIHILLICSCVYKITKNF